MLFFGMLVMGIFEVVGVASIAPFIAVVANPEIIRLENNPLAALITFVQLAVGLSVVSFGLIGYKSSISKFTAIGLGILIIFGRLVF